MLLMTSGFLGFHGPDFPDVRRPLNFPSIWLPHLETSQLVSSLFVWHSSGAQMLVYEDNFGFLNISEPRERAFFDFVRRQSALMACERCERPVRLIPPKALCASCVSALECRASLIEEYGNQETLLDPIHPS